jgi:DNA-binding transcriptional regulator GbsR (MarR family)
VTDHDPRLHFVEEIGLFFDRSGLTRMAGRILGWLLVCDPPHQSMSEMAEALQASKGSISSMTRFLIHVGLVERVSLPGERRDYFRIRPNAWIELMQAKAGEITRMRRLAEQGLEVLNSNDPALRERLENMRDTYLFLEDEFPALLKRWQDEQHRA